MIETASLSPHRMKSEVVFLSCSGDALLLLATAVSLQLVRGRTTEEIELMAAFFTVLGDNLALWLAHPGTSDSNGETVC